MENQRPCRSRKVFDFLVGHRTTDSGGGDLLYLVAIDEAKPMMVRLHGNAVKEIKFWDLQHVLDLAELSAGRTENRCPHFQRHVGDWPTLIHVNLREP